MAAADEVGEARPWIAREGDACTECETAEAVLIPTRGQNCVYCVTCGKFLYNAPKHETGDAPRTVAALRKGTKPSQQARIAIRDLGRCICCHTTENLTIAHLISVHDAVEMGLDPAVTEADENKALMCETCNGGLGPLSVTARFLVAHALRIELEHRTVRQGEAS